MTPPLGSVVQNILYEIFSFVASSYTKAGKLPLDLWRNTAGLLLGGDCQFAGSVVHLTSIGRS